MESDFTEVIAVFDIGRTWKRFRLFDRNLNSVHTDERIIDGNAGGSGMPGEGAAAISVWMEACLKGAAGTSLYRILTVTLAAGEDSLPELETALSGILKSGAAGDAVFSGRGMNSTSASLVPYLKNPDKPFILVSTGTSCTFMNPFYNEPLSGEKSIADITSGTHDSVSGHGPGTDLTLGGKKIRSSRFLLGEVHDRNVTLLDDHFGVTGELYKTIKIKHKKILKIQSVRRGRVFFRHGIPEDFADKTAVLSHFLTYADAYHQMMYDLVDECLQAFRNIISEEDSTEIIYVTGGFANNDTFVRILAARIPGKRVYASTIDYSTALGAAMEVYQETFNADLPPVYLGLKAILLRDE